MLNQNKPKSFLAWIGGKSLGTAAKALGTYRGHWKNVFSANGYG